MGEQKQKQKFDEQWARLKKLTGEEKPETRPKISGSRVTEIFEEVAKERVKKAEEDFKIKLISILEAKLALDKALQKGRDELQKKEEQEYETLNKELSAAYGMLENAQKQGNALVTAAQGNLNTESKTEDTEGPKAPEGENL